eukprot:tig00020553_g10764.t1
MELAALRTVVRFRRGPVYEPAADSFATTDGAVVWPDKSYRGERVFGFDRVLGERSTQRDVYEEVGARAVDLLLQGVSSAVLVYGESGSGKTHSAEGSPVEGVDPDADGRGLVPRMLCELIDAAAVDPDATVVPFAVSAADGEVLSDACRPRNTHLRVSASGAVQGLSQHRVASPSDVQELMERVRAARSISGGAERARLCHVVYTIRLEPEGSAVLAVARLADAELAREGEASALDPPGVSRPPPAPPAARQRVARAFSALAGVLATLLGPVVPPLSPPPPPPAEPVPVPYRDSKLTHVLRPALTPPFEATLLAHARPPCGRGEADESLLTLKGAPRGAPLLLPAASHDAPSPSPPPPPPPARSPSPPSAPASGFLPAPPAPPRPASLEEIAAERLPLDPEPERLEDPTTPSKRLREVLRRQRAAAGRARPGLALEEPEPISPGGTDAGGGLPPPQASFVSSAGSPGRAYPLFGPSPSPSPPASTSAAAAASLRQRVGSALAASAGGGAGGGAGWRDPGDDADGGYGYAFDAEDGGDDDDGFPEPPQPDASFVVPPSAPSSAGRPAGQRRAISPIRAGPPSGPASPLRPGERLERTLEEAAACVEALERAAAGGGEDPAAAWDRARDSLRGVRAALEGSASGALRRSLLKAAMRADSAERPAPASPGPGAGRARTTRGCFGRRARTRPRTASSSTASARPSRRLERRLFDGARSDAAAALAARAAAAEEEAAGLRGALALARGQLAEANEEAGRARQEAGELRRRLELSSLLCSRQVQAQLVADAGALEEARAARRAALEAARARAADLVEKERARGARRACFAAWAAEARAAREERAGERARAAAAALAAWRAAAGEARAREAAAGRLAARRGARALAAAFRAWARRAELGPSSAERHAALVLRARREAARSRAALRCWLAWARRRARNRRAVARAHVARSLSRAASVLRAMALWRRGAAEVEGRHHLYALLDRALAWGERRAARSAAKEALLEWRGAGLERGRARGAEEAARLRDRLAGAERDLARVRDERDASDDRLVEVDAERRVLRGRLAEVRGALAARCAALEARGELRRAWAAWRLHCVGRARRREHLAGLTAAGRDRRAAATALAAWRQQLHEARIERDRACLLDAVAKIRELDARLQRSEATSFVVQKYCQDIQSTMAQITPAQ